MARILIVEDVTLYRRGITECLAGLGHEVVSVEPEGKESYVMATSRIIREIHAGKKEFDIVLMDYDLGDRPPSSLVPPITGDLFTSNFLCKSGSIRKKGLKVISISTRDSYDRDLYDGALPNKEEIGEFRETFQKLYSELFPQTEGENMSEKHA